MTNSSEASEFETTLAVSRRSILGGLGGAAVFCMVPRVVRSENHGAAVNIREKGARGDGQTDDTKAIQSAIDAISSDGGEVLFPAGTYMVDAITSIHLRSKTRLKFEEGAVLRALPNDSGAYAILYGKDCSDLEISGGHLVGERDQHRGDKGEWGMGLKLEGCRRVRVHGMIAEQCWGDGFYLGASTPATAAGEECADVTLSNVTAIRNRRQGLSIVGCLGAVIENSSFSGTVGKPPQSGIDLEPDGAKRVLDIVIKDCEIFDNHEFGIAVVGNTTSNVTIRGNRVHGNEFAGIMLARSASKVFVQENVLHSNKGGDMLVMESACDNVIARNHFLTSGGSAAPGVAHLTIAKGAARNAVRDNEFSTNPTAPVDIEIQASAGPQMIGTNHRAGLGAAVKIHGLAQ